MDASVLENGTTSLQLELHDRPHSLQAMTHASATLWTMDKSQTLPRGLKGCNLPAVGVSAAVPKKIDDVFIDC